MEKAYFFIGVLIFIVVSNLIRLIIKKHIDKKTERLTKLCFILSAELQSTFSPSILNVLCLLNISKRDFKKVSVMYYQLFERILIDELYDFLQPDHLKTLEMLISKNRFERVAKRYILKNHATELHDFLIFENKDINALIKILDKLPDNTFDDLRFVYFTLFQKDLEDITFFNDPQIRGILKRVF